MTQNPKSIESRERKQWLHEHHICVQCKAQDAYTLAGHWLCYECQQKANHNARVARQNAARKAVRRATDRERRLQYKEDGKCVECGRRLSNGLYAACERCRQKNAEAKRLKGNKLPKGEDGRCYRCNREMAMPGKRVCAECYPEMVAMARNARSGWQLDRSHYWDKLNKLIFRGNKQ